VAFPINGVLSTFTGADENPLLEGGGWGGPIASGNTQLRRLSNAATSNGALSQSYWSAAFGPDSEVYVDVPVLQEAGQRISLFLRIHDPGNAATASCYRFSFGIPNTFSYVKLTSGSSYSTLATFTDHTLVAGESLGFTALGMASVVLQGYYKSAGVWTPVAASATDASSPIDTAGYIGLEASYAASDLVRFDNFGGGSVNSAGGVTLADVPQVIQGTKL
jgi:hypothetical protein